MNHLFSYLTLICFLSFSQIMTYGQKSISVDQEWHLSQNIIRGTAEAELIIRIGDIDNFGLGWQQGSDPFCVNSLLPHSPIPNVNQKDESGFDRLLYSSHFNQNGKHPCGNDDYSRYFKTTKLVNTSYLIPTKTAKDLSIKDATLEIFFDGLQAPTYCSEFQLFINGIPYPEGEAILNALNQSGKSGNLISIPISQDFYEALSSGNDLSLKIDERTGSADGFMIDFMRLVINKSNKNACLGTLKGKVINILNRAPVAGAKVSIFDNMSAITNSLGEFSFENTPTGFKFVTASYANFSDTSFLVDLKNNKEVTNEDILIAITPATKPIELFDMHFPIGVTIAVNGLKFQHDSPLEISGKANEELNELSVCLLKFPRAEIELITFCFALKDEGLNSKSAFKRAKLCKEYLVRKGIDAKRITVVGYGPGKFSNSQENINRKEIITKMRFKRA
jgi:outer membrane protein OmpA-like peptidoglycan-associated protein